jgi:hypothetical protein
MKLLTIKLKLLTLLIQVKALRLSMPLLKGKSKRRVMLKLVALQLQLAKAAMPYYAIKMQRQLTGLFKQSIQLY